MVRKRGQRAVARLVSYKGQTSATAMISINFGGVVVRADVTAASIQEAIAYRKNLSCFAKVKILKINETAPCCFN